MSICQCCTCVHSDDPALGCAIVAERSDVHEWIERTMTNVPRVRLSDHQRDFLCPPSGAAPCPGRTVRPSTTTDHTSEPAIVDRQGLSLIARLLELEDTIAKLLPGGEDAAPPYLILDRSEIGMLARLVREARAAAQRESE